MTPDCQKKKKKDVLCDSVLQTEQSCNNKWAYRWSKLSPICYFSLQMQKKDNLIIMPKYNLIADKSMLFDGCPTVKLGKISVEPW